MLARNIAAEKKLWTKKSQSWILVVWYQKKYGDLEI